MENNQRGRHGECGSFVLSFASGPGAGLDGEEKSFTDYPALA
jgi:hypothetical protein